MIPCYYHGMKSNNAMMDIETMQLKKLRSMTGEERSLFVYEWSEFVKSVTLARIQNEHPEWDKIEIANEFFREQFPDEWTLLQYEK